MRRLLLLVVALVLLAGCSSGSSPSPSPARSTTAPASASVTAAPAPAAPAVDACYRLSYEAAVAPSSDAAAVPCAKPHTSQTYAVGTLDLVSGGHLLAVDSDAAKAQVAKRCPNKLAAYVGATADQLRLSLLRAVWFTPTVEQGDDGAAWFRCDVIAPTGDSSLARVHQSLAGALKSDSSRELYAMCGTAQPGSPGFQHVLCRDQHSWKAISVVDLSKDGPAYPGVKAVRAAGEDSVCSDAAREIASDALDYQWGYEWPTAAQWTAGQTYGRCWAPDGSSPRMGHPISVT